MSISKVAKKLLYKTLSFENYLRVLSKVYFISYKAGWLKNNPNIQYPYFLKNVIKRGDTIIDIGANLGYYTCLFAEWTGKNGKVYAVEPVEPVRNVLRRNAKKFAQVEILPYALGTENKDIALGNDSLKSFGYVATGRHFVMDSPEATENPEITFKAQMRRGSELFGELPKIDFIKCDTEGYETIILPEIKEVIRQHTPTVLVETGGENRKQILTLMQDLGYEPFVLKNQALIPLQQVDTDDILFIHGTKKSGFAL
ncbi:hypothetical protein FACS189434_08850 [Bacteroidia bacterium]|nr:hypothetical protein FACS189434_08850 [Bacteroidia bacterium]